MSKALDLLKELEELNSDVVEASGLVHTIRKELEWKPIETAPKNRKILVCSTTICKGYSQRVVVDKLVVARTYEGFGRFNPSAYHPTHWIDLPELPSAKTT